MKFKFLLIGLLLLACLSTAIAEGGAVSLSTANSLAITPACEREINETVLTGYEENIIKEGYSETFYDDNASPYEVYRYPVIKQEPIYENITYTEHWDCDETIDYKLEASWINETHINLSIKDLRIQSDFIKAENMDYINSNLIDNYFPARIYDPETEVFDDVGLTTIRNLIDRFNYNQVVSKEDILGKEYHIGESSAVYVVTSGTEHNISNGLVRVTWDTASDEGELCWYNTTYNCIKLEFVGYSSTTASSGGSYTKSWLEIVSGSDKANISLGAGFFPQIKFTGAGSINLTGDADFTADYSYIKGIGMYNTGNNDIDSDNAESGLVLWDNSTNMGIAIQPTLVDSGNWRSDFDNDIYEIDYATGENVNLIIFDGIDVSTNTGEYGSSVWITDASQTASIDEDFSDSVLNTNHWVCAGCDYTSGDTLKITNGQMESLNKIEIKPNEINETAGTVRIKARLLLSSADLLNNGHLMLLSFPGKELSFYTIADNTFNAYSPTMGHVCLDVANGTTVTDYNVWEIAVADGNATFNINGDEKCTFKYNQTRDVNYKIGEQFINGYVQIDYVNYSVESLPDTLDNDDSAEFWNVTQTPSFAESWSNASFREVDISRSYNDATKIYTDTYTYTNITNDFSTMDGTDGIPYFASALVNATNIDTTMLYWIPSEWGNYSAALNSSILSTITYSISTLPDIIITSPLNQSYISSTIDLGFKAIGNTASYNCELNHNNNITDLGTINNDTLTEWGLNALVGENNFNVTCPSGTPYYHNATNSTIYTIEDVNFTLTQNATAYEGITNRYTVDIGLNTEVISHVNASLYWNDTFIGFAEIANTSPSNTRANMTFTIPIIVTNNTSINTYWNITKLYINGSTFYENSSTSAQACWHSWDWDATTYSYNLLERSLNDISVNITKLGGVGYPVNTTISALLVWNGSPSTMTATMNTSTLLGYSNTTRMPRIPVHYNWTFGFNVTLNYSINHGILGYNSRADTNTTYNYTQTAHIAWLGNCTVVNKPFVQALNFYMYNEESEGAVTENFQAERINIKLADGTSRNYSLAEMTGYTNYSICIYPYWSNYSSVNIDVKYATNSSTYDARRHYLINYSIDNSSNNIGLYNLDGTPITFTVLDETGSEAPDVYLDIKRFYASINNYKTIAMTKTGDSGTASTYLDVKLCTGSTETLYAIDIYDNRSILIKSLPDQSFSDEDCDGVADETLKITIGEVVYDFWARNEALSYSNITVNDSNNINFTSIVNDSLGLVSTITLTCYRVRNIGNLLISTETVTASSATITCILGNVTGNYYIMQTVVNYPSVGAVTFTEVIEPGSRIDFGGDGLMAGFFLLVALAVGYATTPAMSLVALIIGLIIIYSLELTLFSLDAIITLIFSIIFIIYIIGRKR